MWLDASDPYATGTAPAMNSSLTTWNNKLNGAQHVISGNASGLIYKGTSGIQHSGAYLSLGDGTLPHGNSPFVYFFVFNANQNNNVSLLGLGSSYALGEYIALQLRGIDTNFYAGQDLLLTPVVSAGAKTLMMVSYTPSTTSRRITVNASNTISSTISSFNLPSNYQFIGAQYNGSDIFNGYMYEVLVFNTELSVANRQSIEGYLAKKWGFKSTLPTNHPYYTLNPSSFGWNSLTILANKIETGITEPSVLTGPIGDYYINRTSGNLSKFTSSPFNPLEIGDLQNWYDAADPLATGSVPTNGSNISMWKDKSGNSRNTTGSGGTTVTKGDDGYPFLDFNNSYFNIPEMTWTFNEYYTIFLVETTRNFNGNGMLYLSSSSYNGPAQGMNFLAPNNSGVYYGIRQDNSAFYGAPYPYLQTGVTRVWSLVFTNAPYTNTFAIYLNGELMATKNAVSMLTALGISQIGTGMGAPSVSFYNGKMREILAYKGIMTETNQQKIEGYLAWKWGQNDSFPSSHPYYSSEPKLLAWTSMVPFMTKINNAITLDNKYSLGSVSTFDNPAIQNTFTTNATTSKLYVKIWGGGGQGALGYAGGRGAYVSGILNVKPSTTYTIQVGYGGAQSGSTNAYAGGNGSSIKLNGVDMVIAGGGGSSYFGDRRGKASSGTAFTGFAYGDGIIGDGGYSLLNNLEQFYGINGGDDGWNSDIDWNGTAGLTSTGYTAAQNGQVVIYPLINETFIRTSNILGDLNIIGQIYNNGQPLYSGLPQITTSAPGLVIGFSLATDGFYSSLDGLTWSKGPNSLLTLIDTTASDVVFFVPIVSNGSIYLSGVRYNTPHASARILYSLDGINWSYVSFDGSQYFYNLNSITWHPTKKFWLATFDPQQTADTNKYATATSIDGITWTPGVKINAFGAMANQYLQFWTDSFAARSAFFTNGKFYMNTYSHGLISSSDGQSWVVSGGGGNNSFVVTNGTIFVNAYRAWSVGSITYSTDYGVTWQAANVSVGGFGAVAHDLSYCDIIWNGSMFLMSLANCNQTVMMRSTDGINWYDVPDVKTYVAIGFTQGGQQLAWTGSRWVLTTTNGKYLHSTDGITWTQRLSSTLPSTVSSSSGSLFDDLGSYISPVPAANVYVNGTLSVPIISYKPATSSDWASPVPTDLASAIDRLATAVKGLLTAAIP